MEKMKVSIVIPFYNEEKIIKNTVDRLVEYMENHFSDYEVIFSNDGSTDKSEEILKACEHPKVKIVGYEQNHGKGYAVRYGMAHTDGDVCIFTDSDLAYGTDVLSRITDVFEKQNPDLVIGSRNLDKDGYENYTFIRKLASKTYIKLLCLVAGFRYSDSQCGIKGFRGEIARKIFAECETDGFAFDQEVLIKADRMNANVVEMPVKVITHNESKVHVVRDTFRMLKELRAIKKRNPKKK